MNPERARENFLKLQNFGVTTADELDRIMQKFMPALIRKIDDEDNGSEILNVRQRAIHAVETLCVGLRYPFDILEKFPSESLTNLLETEMECDHGSFSDFLVTYDQAIFRLRMQRGYSLENINELDEIISLLLGKRLDACGVDRKIEPYLRFLMRGGIPPRPMLDILVTLENVQPEIFQAIETEPDEKRDISEILFTAFSGLDDRQFEIIKRRYGIDMDRSETLQEVSSNYDISTERVRQIQVGSLKKMATRRVVKALVAALNRENILQDLFSDRKIIPVDGIQGMYNSLDFKKRLAIDLAYGNIRLFLDACSIRTEGAWVQEQDLHMVESEPVHLLESLGKRITVALRKQRLPITLSGVKSEIPDYPESVVRDEIVKTMKISIDGDIIDASTLRVSIRCLLVLREAGHAMVMQDIYSEVCQLFNRNEKFEKIHSAISNDPEFLIVERGTYNIYENLDLTMENIDYIRNCTYSYLKVIGGLISVKVLFPRLFRNMKEQFGKSFGPYMLLGFLQHDPRFITCRGLMVGLASEGGKTKYRSLGEDIRAVFLKSGGLMTSAEITRHLRDRRDVQETSVSTAIRKMPDVIQHKRGCYGLVEKTGKSKD